MSNSTIVRITHDRAESLLTQCRWILVISALSLITAVGLDLSETGSQALVFILVCVYVFGGFGYLICLGRLAYGLGRSVAYYVGVTLLASNVVFVVAHLIAYGNIKTAVENATYPGSTAEDVKQRGW
jgi:hypothetical protein